MTTKRLGIIMNGVTGRMGLNQHLVRSIIAIRDQGGVTLPNGDRVMLDPILVDCALQMQVLWTRVHWGVTPLPAEIHVWRRFAPLLSSGVAVRHELRLRPESRSPMCTADHWLYGPEGELVATLTGVQGVGSRALNRLATVTA